MGPSGRGQGALRGLLGAFWRPLGRKISHPGTSGYDFRQKAKYCVSCWREAQFCRSMLPHGASWSSFFLLCHRSNTHIKHEACKTTIKTDSTSFWTPSGTPLFRPKTLPRAFLFLFYVLQNPTCGNIPKLFDGCTKIYTVFVFIFICLMHLSCVH